MEILVQRIGHNGVINSYASLETRYPADIILIYAYRTVKIRSVIRHAWVTTETVKPWAETMLIVGATICAFKHILPVK